MAAKQGSYLVIFADTVGRDQARQSLQDVFARHGGTGSIARESDLTIMFKVDGIDDATLAEITKLPGLYGVDDANIRLELA